MSLTKTDFLEYLRCPNNFWLMKKEPESFVPPVDSEFEVTKMREGYEVEQYAQRLFPDGITVDGDVEEQIQKTQTFVQHKKTPLYQANFITPRNILARTDILLYDQGVDAWDIYEVKSSTKVKTDRDNNHIKDVAFQKIALQESGLDVGKVFLVLLNNDYIRDGEVDVTQLFTITDVTDDVDKANEATEREIASAIALLSETQIDRTSCPCIYMSRPNHCSSFHVLNPSVPEYSVHDISRISSDKIKSLVDSGIVSIQDVTDNATLTANQRVQAELAISGASKINVSNIKGELQKLEYPLYFFDYETFSSAIPVLDGFSPHQHLPFQVSLHVLKPNNVLEHLEFLAETVEDAPQNLIEFLKASISSSGTIISWHSSFENTINKKLGEIYPEHAEFLNNLTMRAFDLEKIFRKDYLHPGFRGSSSIKRVLPVILPTFSYEDLDIKGGTEAMEGWRRMVFEDVSDGEKDNIERGLLEYCAMDTLAMVEIFRHLTSLGG